MIYRERQTTVVMVLYVLSKGRGKRIIAERREGIMGSSYSNCCVISLDLWVICVFIDQIKGYCLDLSGTAVFFLVSCSCLCSCLCLCLFLYIYN